MMQRGDRIELPGKILKVRTAPLDENSSIAVIDFRITNPSDVQFEVRTRDGGDGGQSGQELPGPDGQRSGCQAACSKLCRVLGEKYNTTLLMKERLGSHASADRMVAARFQAPLSMVDARKRFIVRMEEVDGKVFEYSER